MSHTHLSPEEFTDAFAGELPVSRQTHLDDCVSCRSSLFELGELASDVTRAVDVPEPSPLFWDHFSAGVKHALDAEPMTSRGWWSGGLRPWLATAALAGAIALAVIQLDRRGVEMPANPAEGTVAASWDGQADSIEEDTRWELVGNMLDALPFEDMTEVVAPMPGADMAGAIASLTPAQRVELMRLLRAEIGATE